MQAGGSWSREDHEALACLPSDDSSDGVVDWESSSPLTAPAAQEQPAALPDDFLNFSFKNLELLGERNREMAESFVGLRTQFGASDPYHEAEG